MLDRSCAEKEVRLTELINEPDYSNEAIQHHLHNTHRHVKTPWLETSPCEKRLCLLKMSPLCTLLPRTSLFRWPIFSTSTSTSTLVRQDGLDEMHDFPPIHNKSSSTSHKKKGLKKATVLLSSPVCFDPQYHVRSSV